MRLSVGAPKSGTELNARAILGAAGMTYDDLGKVEYLPFGESASTLTLADARNNPQSVRPQAFTQGWGESTTQQQAGLTVQHQVTDGHVLRATAWAISSTARGETLASDVRDEPAMRMAANTAPPSSTAARP